MFRGRMCERPKCFNLGELCALGFCPACCNEVHPAKRDLRSVINGKEEVFSCEHIRVGALKVIPPADSAASTSSFAMVPEVVLEKKATYQPPLPGDFILVQNDLCSLPEIKTLLT